ncbi:MAG TPA: L28 family ribosomal protein [Candidatus Nitrosocosmicus sp.]|nr:L28 family ribosomal protein [Candidatus Nitrosocosmicus sp.]
MAFCFYCEKGNIRGTSHTHHRGVAGGRWKKRAPKTLKIFKPNLQPVTVVQDNEQFAVKLCTKCIKRIKKDSSEGKKPFLNLVTTSIAKEKEEVVNSTQATS